MTKYLWQWSLFFSLPWQRTLNSRHSSHDRRSLLFGFSVDSTCSTGLEAGSMIAKSQGKETRVVTAFRYSREHKVAEWESGIWIVCDRKKNVERKECMKSDIRCWFKEVTWRQLRSEIPKPPSYSSVYRNRNLSECELSTSIRYYLWYRQHLIDSLIVKQWVLADGFLEFLKFLSRKWFSTSSTQAPRMDQCSPSFSFTFPPSRDCIPRFPPFHHIHHGCSQASAYFFLLSLLSHWKNSSASSLPPFSSLQMSMKPEQGKSRERLMEQCRTLGELLHYLVLR